MVRGSIAGPAQYGVPATGRSARVTSGNRKGWGWIAWHALGRLNMAKPALEETNHSTAKLVPTGSGFCFHGFGAVKFEFFVKKRLVSSSLAPRPEGELHFSPAGQLLTFTFSS